MDIRCRKCGEPWDMDTLHEEVTERFAGTDRMRAYDDSGPCKDQKLYEPMYHEVRDDFYARGCEAFSFAGPCQESGSDREALVGALYDELGDDLDGLAAEMEDYGL